MLNDEFSMTKNRNPIEFIKTRIKQPDSIATKLKKKGYPITVAKASDRFQAGWMVQLFPHFGAAAKNQNRTRHKAILR